MNHAIHTTDLDPGEATMAACPSCGRSEAESRLVSTHTTSEGVVSYTRCACGLVQVRLRPYAAETERLVVAAMR